MRIFVIADIHGCLNVLKKTFSKIEGELEKDYTRLVFLGDYIHGGEDSQGVLDFLIQLKERYGRDKVIALRGNHEDFVLAGYSTIEELRPSYPGQVDERYLSWMEGLASYYHEGSTIFTHAGIDEDLGENWTYTDDKTFTSKYPADLGRVDGLADKIVAGHIYTQEISGDPSFSDIYFDGLSHYYLDGDVLKTGKLNLMLVETGDKEDRYFELREGAFQPVAEFFG